MDERYEKEHFIHDRIVPSKAPKYFLIAFLESRDRGIHLYELKETWAGPLGHLRLHHPWRPDVSRDSVSHILEIRSFEFSYIHNSDARDVEEMKNSADNG